MQPGLKYLYFSKQNVNGHLTDWSQETYIEFKSKGSWQSFQMFKPPGRLLETGVNTLQKTLILKKQAELEEVDKELCRKRQEFKSRMEILTQRKSELKAEQQQVSVDSSHPEVIRRRRPSVGGELLIQHHYLPATSSLTQNKERRMKFEKFVAENEAKRLQAMKKYEAAQEQNKLKQREIEHLREELKQRKSRWELKTTAVCWAYNL